MQRYVTIKDVAKAAGVSHSTVSRVFHNKVSVAPETKIRIQAVIDELGYKPNLVARGLVTQHTQAIGLITPSPTILTHPLIESIADNGKNYDYALLLCPANTWEHEHLSFERVDQNWQFDGIIVYSILHHKKIPEEVLNLQTTGMPIVFLNKFLNEKTLNTVGVDNAHAVQLVVDHLVSLGHRQIGILNGHRHCEDGAIRYMAFLEALAKHGLSLDKRFMRDAVFEDSIAYEQMTDILKQQERPTAMFCANDRMALGALRAIKDKGMKVPHDIALVGFDDIEAARYVSPALTTVRPPLYKVGQLAVDLIMELINNPDRPCEQHALKAELIIRESTSV